MKVRVCPDCGKHNPEVEINCVECGATLSVNTLVDQGESQTSDAPVVHPDTPSNSNSEDTTTLEIPQPDEIFCIRCGSELPGEAKYCWKCGAAVKTGKRISETKTPKAETAPTPASNQKELHSISCATSGCNNSVVGQCGSCGRYYCADHNMGTLCSECGRQKAEQDKYLEYLQTAEGVARKADKGYSRERALSKPILGMMLFIWVIIFLATLCAIQAGDPQQSVLIILYTFLIGVYILGQRQRFYSRRKRAIKEAARINKTKPDFLQFYKTWDSEISFLAELKNDFRSAGEFALNLSGKMASSLVDDSMEDAKRAQLRAVVSDAVDDELKRHGL